MRHLSSFGAVAIASFALATSLCAQENSEQSSAWNGDLAAAQTAAREAKKPLFLVFR